MGLAREPSALLHTSSVVGALPVPMSDSSAIAGWSARTARMAPCDTTGPEKAAAAQARDTAIMDRRSMDLRFDTFRDFIHRGRVP